MKEFLRDLGEEEIIKRLARFATEGQFSDDTACLAKDPRPLLVNTDVLVDNIHFSDTTTNPEDVGWRAVVANLSDLAASGAVEIEGITVALVAPSNTQWNWVNGVYKGIIAALNEFGGVLLGGDCSRGKQRLLSITALGRLGPLRLHRGNAKHGDILVTSGTHGLSRLGLALLKNEQQIKNKRISTVLANKAISKHQHPVARLDALHELLDCKPNSLPWRAGGTDSSDGLIAAIKGLCNSSGCGAVLEWDRMVRPNDWPSGDIWDHWFLSGGEDFELVLSLPPEWGKTWLEALPGSFQLGRITTNSSQITWEKGDKPLKFCGFEHYGNSQK